MILHLIPQEVDGCAYHRIEIPMHNLHGFELAQTTVLDGIADEDLKRNSLIVFSRESGIAEPEKQIKRLRKFGIPYVIDIDDYWKLDKSHLLYDEFRSHVAARWVMLIQNAAAVTTTNEQLARKLRNHNPNVFIIPNALDGKQLQWQRMDLDNGGYYGWVGGTHHVKDIEMLLPCFNEIHKNTNIKLALGGFTLTNEVYHLFDYWMTGGGKYKHYKRIKSENVYNYGRIYDAIDVCLVPLVASKFNACKSSLKVIEAGFKGKPCIVSRVEPYIHDFTDKQVQFVDTPSDWFKAIKFLHENPNRLFDMRAALIERVKDFEISKVNPLREQLYNQIIQHGRAANS